jgi:hypothetical protein
MIAQILSFAVYCGSVLERCSGTEVKRVAAKSIPINANSR